MGCRYKTSGCGCCHSVDQGACTSFENGANGRCVFCDHSKECHSKITNREKEGLHNRP